MSHAFTHLRFHPCQRVMGTLYIHLCKYLVDTRSTCTHTLVYTHYTYAHGHFGVTILHLCTHLGIFVYTHYTCTHTLVYTNYMWTPGTFVYTHYTCTHTLVYTRYTWAHTWAPLYIHITHVHIPLYIHVTHEHTPGHLCIYTLHMYTHPYIYTLNLCPWPVTCPRHLYMHMSKYLVYTHYTCAHT